MADKINVPKTLHAGTDLSWEDCYEDYNPSDYDVSYWIASLTNTEEVAGTPNGSGTGFIFNTASIAFASGVYKWQILATLKSPTKKYVVATGEIVIKALFADTNGVDTRPVQQRLLDQINEWLEGNVTENEQKITHDGMEVWNYDRQGLLDFRVQLMKELTAIRERERRKRGGGFMRQVKWRMP